MNTEFNGLEDRLDELRHRTEKLKKLSGYDRNEFRTDEDLRDIGKRNFEIAAQRCIDTAHRIISLERERKPQDYYASIIKLGEMGVIPSDLAERLAPLTGFRNILAHEYLTVNWDSAYDNFQRLPDLTKFIRYVAEYLENTT